METGRFYNLEQYTQFRKMGQNDIKAIIIGLFEHQNELDINLNELENLLRVDGYI